jgi:hypothetical protein
MNPLGVNGSKTTKPWADAIKRALARRAEGKLADINALADVLIDKVLEGDMQALKEFGDRMDGRPAQAITGPDGDAIKVDASLKVVGIPPV